MSILASVAKADVERLGKWFAKGVIEALGDVVLIVFVVFAVLSVGVPLVGRALNMGPIDDTDTAFGKSSGMAPRRDALTGCEYLETRGGGLTPRLGADGRQICRGGTKP